MGCPAKRQDGGRRMLTHAGRMGTCGCRLPNAAALTWRAGTPPLLRRRSFVACSPPCPTTPPRRPRASCRLGPQIRRSAGGGPIHKIKATPDPVQPIRYVVEPQAQVLDGFIQRGIVPAQAGLADFQCPDALDKRRSEAHGENGPAWCRPDGEIQRRGQVVRYGPGFKPMRMMTYGVKPCRPSSASRPDRYPPLPRRPNRTSRGLPPSQRGSGPRRGRRRARGRLGVRLVLRRQRRTAGRRCRVHRNARQRDQRKPPGAPGVARTGRIIAVKAGGHGRRHIACEFKMHTHVSRDCECC